MKKSLIALAVLAAAGSASAQSSVTLFGIVDATLAWGRGNVADRFQLTHSGYNSSRIGLRGVEDLGGGMSASFWLEGTLANDDGTTGQRIPQTNQAAVHAADGSGLVFNRRSTVSLQGTWGELRLGRDYVPAFWNYTIFDPFGTNGVGTTVNLVGPANGLGVAANAMATAGTRGTLVRASNSIGYFLPANLGGFYGQAMYYDGENASNAGATADDGDGVGARLGFASGPFNVAIAFGRTEYASGDFRQWNIGGQWDFGVAKLMGQYSRDEKGAVDGRGWLIGGLVPVGPGEVRVSYSTYRIDSAVDPRARQLALGYVHNLSKRTAVYTTYARVRNTGGGSYALNGSAVTANSTSSGFDLGIRHSF